LYHQYGYSHDKIWNLDESGAQAGCNGKALVVAHTGSCSIYKVVHDKREWLLVLYCVNANGACILNFYVLKEKCFCRNYIEAYKYGATMAMQPRAWMICFLFAQWISHLVKSMELVGRVSLGHRHFIILDGHASHVSIQIVKEAHEHGIDLLT
jgi:hypothetical protein